MGAIVREQAEWHDMLAECRATIARLKAQRDLATRLAATWVEHGHTDEGRAELLDDLRLGQMPTMRPSFECLEAVRRVTRQGGG